MTMTMRRVLQLFWLVLHHHCLTCHAVRRLPWDVVTSETHTTTSVLETKDQHDSSRNLKKEKVHVPVPSSPEDHRVTSLPLLEQDDTVLDEHYAGLLPASKDGDKYFFYWLFHPPAHAKGNIVEHDIPLIIWLNGGPGCSSMDGLFLEHGPLHWKQQQQQSHNDKTWSLVTNPHSWHLAPAYTVYVDQPVGTGLSFTTSGKYPTNDEQVNVDFYHWLLQFLTLHQDTFLTATTTTTLSPRTLSRPLYFAGESHAGHYIPSMMAYILQQNKKNPDIVIPLAGAAIGNGWVDPFHQYSAARASYSHGLIDLAQQQALQKQETKCQKDLTKNQYRSNDCFALLDDIVSQSQGVSGNLKVSPYDARFWEPKQASRTFPPGHKIVESYLGGWATPSSDPPLTSNLTQVLEAIHAIPSQQAGQRYQECTDPPYNALSHSDGMGVVPEVVTLLENNVRLLFFNGMMDLICNHVGNEVLLEQLPWTHRDEWTQAQRYSWTAPSQSTPSGYMKEYKNLAFLKVLNSGHMVPLDVPEVAFDMIQTFVYQGSFDSSAQDLDRALQDGGECPVCPSCKDTSSTSANSATTDTTQVDTNPVMGYVIAHSWMGAIFAVVVFVFGLGMVRRRQGLRGGNHWSLPGYDLEMREDYRDEPDDMDTVYTEDLPSTPPSSRIL